MKLSNILQEISIRIPLIPSTEPVEVELKDKKLDLLKKKLKKSSDEEFDKECFLDVLKQKIEKEYEDLSKD